MWYIISVVVLSILVGIVLLKGVTYTMSKIDKYQENSVIDLFIDYPKSIIAFLFVMVLIGFYMVSHQIGEMYTCAIRSSSQNVETEYSWYFDKCRFKNKDGAWVDIDRLLGMPDGKEHEQQ